jgi:hypothetical protein
VVIYTPEQKARHAENERKRRARMTPEQQAKAKARRATPERKAAHAARSRANYATPEGKAKSTAQLKAYRASPEGKAARATYYAQPEGKAARVVASRKRLLAGYGLTPEQYDLILAAQGGRCAICQCMPRTRLLAVDHCHKSKVKGLLKDVRGLLCSRCNHGLLGSGHDKVELLERAVDYLLHPPAPAALYAEEGTCTDG